ncbi:MAG TPA: PVC-type heme-binding CxxCH protein [Chryseolinea sp.]|nr:PVC-type heme-binding CxxCH protein [Chryseolinea sp.]
MANSIKNISLLHILFILLLLSGCKKEASTNLNDPLSTFEIEDGFKIELIASEPLIGDPVDMEIDETGTLYIVEMPGYPLDKSGSGKIKVLSDTDGDGRMDKSTVFAENLILPNSVMRWKNGIMVTDAPNVFYFEDGDGDGKAEIRDTLLTGFALSNPQHNLNSPVLGIDNWIYLAHEEAVTTETYQKEFGDPGKEIFFPDNPSSPRLDINAGGRAVRFRPDQHIVEMTSSASQFGHAFDTWGHHFEVGNSNHIYQEVIAQSYLSRNPHLPISDATEHLSDHMPASEVFSITQNPEHQLLTDVGVITSACGLTTYLGGLFPAPYDNATFVAEPVNNLLHVDLLTDHGAIFQAKRMHSNKEFLASTDFRFRPVNTYVGPDGALYVVDYYRQIIEHPEWMGDEVVKSGELYNDRDKGRIYRITPTDAPSAQWTKGLDLGKATNEQLVEKLADKNIWWRLNAQRLLIDRALLDNSSVAALTKMTQNSASSVGRLHALWTLEALSELKKEHIEAALRDPVAGIRENAIRLAELHLSEFKDAQPLLKLQDDADPKVRFQLLCTLGSVKSAEAEQARHKLLLRDVSDQWVQVAAMTVPSSETASLLKFVLSNYKEGNTDFASLVKRLTTMVGSIGEPNAIHQLIQKAAVTDSKVTWQPSALEGLAEGIQNDKEALKLSPAGQTLLLKTFFESAAGTMRKASLHLLIETRQNKGIDDSYMKRALAIVNDHAEQEDKRADAVDFLALGNPADHIVLLKKLIIPTEQLSVQLASLRTMSTIKDTAVFGYLIRQWPNLTPDLRDPAVRTFLADDERIAMLLHALESGRIQTSEVSWGRKVRLMVNSNETLRNKARQLFTKTNDEEINRAYKGALETQGDAIKGKNVYQQQCALCHQVRGKIGVTLGPDLGTIHNWSKEAIMANILAPNQSISSGYELWEVVLNNGESFQGIIASETPGAITLRNLGSAEKTVRREDIKSLKALSMSIMTEGLEKQISVDDMADLLTFLKSSEQ